MSQYLDEEGGDSSSLIKDASEAVDRAAGTYKKFPREFERIIFVLLVIGSYFLGKSDMKELYLNCQKINDEILKMSITNALKSETRKEENLILEKKIDSLKYINDNLPDSLESNNTKP